MDDLLNPTNESPSDVAATEPPVVVRTAIDLLNDAPTGRFHRRAVVVSGMGFFTDAYDLFVISTVAALVKTQWGLSATETSWVTGAAILGAFVGAFVFGRLADVFGRKTTYVTVAAIMIVGALASAVAPSFIWLVVARFVLGLGIGGDYPVSAVLMSEYSNRKDRGRLVGLVFSMQALGLIVGPLVALVLLSVGLADPVVWRLLLGLGAVPAAAVIYLRGRMPESPRFVHHVKGDHEAATRSLVAFAQGEIVADGPVVATASARVTWRQFMSSAKSWRLILGTAGAWFLFDYAYYGNTLSLPVILARVAPTGTLKVDLLWSLAMFVVFAVPGYLVAVARMDRVGHRRLQYIGFAVMVACFAVLAAVPALTTAIVPFVLIFGVSYFFVEFGPNTTTFVLPSEVFPVSQRTTGHGMAAGIGKLGAFVGVFMVPSLDSSLGLRGMLAVAAGAAVLGFVVTGLLPETKGRTLEEIAGDAAA
ncbi:MAG TPA: MFS transporter [Acidimicrobiales bacterium]|nr:MFS transporter [Acidimicrobiales bacterium]